VKRYKAIKVLLLFLFIINLNSASAIGLQENTDDRYYPERAKLEIENQFMKKAQESFNNGSWGQTITYLKEFLNTQTDASRQSKNISLCNFGKLLY